MEITTNNSSVQYMKLSIQVSLNGLSFCTQNKEGVITSLEHENFGIQLTPQQVLDKIKIAFNTVPALKEDFKDIEVLYQNDLHTLIPRALFDKDALKEYLQYTIRVLENDFIAYDILPQHDMVNVYIPYVNINNFFFETFGSFTYKHTMSVLVNNLLAKEKNSDSTVVYAHMNKKHVDVLIFVKGKLLLNNTYFYENEEDFLYYVLFAVEQLRLNPEEFQFIFLGGVEKESDYYTIAHKYIRHVSFGTLQTSSLEFENTITPPAPHQHFVLLGTI